MTEPLTLYWISGSPPAWRVMLTLVLKGLSYDSRRLDHAAGENRTPEYLALNPKGQVPTLTAGDLVIRESVAIMAWLDGAFPARPIFGADAPAAAVVWQDLVEMENDLRPAVATIAGTLLRGEADERAAALEAATDTAATWADGLAARLSDAPFLGGEAPMAADLWLYPSVGWIERAAAKAGGAAPARVVRLLDDRPALAAWRSRLRALPGVAATTPPHWRDPPA